MMGIVHEDVCTFLLLSRSFLLRMRNVSDKLCTETQNTRIMLNNFFLKIVPLMKKMWKNMVEPDRPQMAIHTANALSMLDNTDYRHTLETENTVCFSTSTNGYSNAPQCCVHFLTCLHSSSLRPQKFRGSS